MRHRTDVHIRPTVETDTESFCDGINGIAKEKWYVATVEGFSLEQTRTFLKKIVENSLPQVVAVSEKIVVGWCDIIPRKTTGFMHIGTLGMGVRREWRRQGIGHRLLEACVPLARRAGVEKVELEVYSDNEGAVRLYERFGFKHEGLKVRGRKLEGRYQDILLMALWLEGNNDA
jgi:ribosomal protein S18 acetylase RimI-like enzyme